MERFNMDSGGEKERRRAQRINMRIPAVAEFADQFEQTVKTRFELQTRDVSQTGVFLVGEVACAVGAALRLVLKMGKAVVEAIGKVVRRDHDGIAIVFSDTSVVFS
jgi:hypothetical protein